MISDKLLHVTMPGFNGEVVRSSKKAEFYQKFLAPHRFKYQVAVRQNSLRERMVAFRRTARVGLQGGLVIDMWQTTLFLAFISQTEDKGLSCCRSLFHISDTKERSTNTSECRSSVHHKNIS